MDNLLKQEFAQKAKMLATQNENCTAAWLEGEFMQAMIDAYYIGYQQRNLDHPV